MAMSVGLVKCRVSSERTYPGGIPTAGTVEAVGRRKASRREKRRSIGRKSRRVMRVNARGVEGLMGSYIETGSVIFREFRVCANGLVLIYHRLWMNPKMESYIGGIYRPRVRFSWF